MRSERIRPPLGWAAAESVETAVDVFVGYLMLDVWIANQDRHHENWSLVITRGRDVHLAPSYDHASSLGANETDANRLDRLTTRDEGRSMQRYVERATSAFYPSVSPAAKVMSTMEAFQGAGRFGLDAVQAWLRRLEQVSPNDTRRILGQVPPERITQPAVEFAQRMLEINRERLLALGGG